MSNPALIIQFRKKTHTELSMKIINQDDSRIRRQTFGLNASNGLIIKSRLYPELEIGGIFLRGSEREKDNYEPSVSFGSSSELSRFISDASYAINELNNQIGE